MSFLICGHCQRHVKVGDSSCPFCASSLDGAAPAGNPSARGGGRSRLAVLFGATTALVTSAAAAAACGGSTTTTVSTDSGSPTTTAVAAYGVAVPEDAGAQFKDSGAPVAAYGVAQPVDSGSD